VAAAFLATFADFFTVVSLAAFVFAAFLIAAFLIAVFLLAVLSRFMGSVPSAAEFEWRLHPVVASR
jgi:hypothetical protein